MSLSGTWRGSWPPEYPLLLTTGRGLVSLERLEQNFVFPPKETKIAHKKSWNWCINYVEGLRINILSSVHLFFLKLFFWSDVKVEDFKKREEQVLISTLICECVCVNTFERKKTAEGRGWCCSQHWLMPVCSASCWRTTVRLVGRRRGCI